MNVFFKYKKIMKFRWSKMPVFVVCMKSGQFYSKFTFVYWCSTIS